MTQNSLWSAHSSTSEGGVSGTRKTRPGRYAPSPEHEANCSPNSLEMTMEDSGKFEMTIRVLDLEVLGFSLAIEDFRVKWLFISIAAFGGIMATLATFGPEVKSLLVG